MSAGVGNLQLAIGQVRAVVTVAAKLLGTGEDFSDLPIVEFVDALGTLLANVECEANKLERSEIDAAQSLAVRR